MSCHSSPTFSKPRSRNLRTPCASLKSIRSRHARASFREERTPSLYPYSNKAVITAGRSYERAEVGISVRAGETNRVEVTLIRTEDR